MNGKMKFILPVLTLGAAAAVVIALNPVQERDGSISRSVDEAFEQHAKSQQQSPVKQQDHFDQTLPVAQVEPTHPDVKSEPVEDLQPIASEMTQAFPDETTLGSDEIAQRPDSPKTEQLIQQVEQIEANQVTDEQVPVQMTEAEIYYERQELEQQIAREAVERQQQVQHEQDLPPMEQ